SLYLTNAQLTHTRTTYTGREVAEQFICQLINLRTYLVIKQIGGDQAHSTVDIKTDAARRDDAMFGMCRSYTADRKTIAPVNIRHCQRITHNSRQSRHVCHLL